MKYFLQIEKLCIEGKIDKIYIPLQSMQPRILKLMNRPYEIETVKQNILKLKKYKEVKTETVVIIGFPTETEEDFDGNLNFLKEVNCDCVYVHAYTDMPNTESSQLQNKIDKETILARYEKLKSTSINYDRPRAKLEFERFKNL
jgi:tRNA-2-methylthio-N6-dimethylallyladenosine synthase